MSDTFVIFLERASDPWALALISFCLAGVVVVCGALALEPRDRRPYSDNQSTDRRDDAFFDKITEFHNEV